MNWKRNIVLLSALVLVAGWYYFYEIRGEALRRTRSIESVRILPGALVTDVQKFSIQRFVTLPDDIPDIEMSDKVYTIEIVRSNDRWVLTQPVQADCDQDYADKAILRFTQLQKGRTVDEKPDSLTPYGLDNPAFKVSLDCADQSTICFIGDKNPVGDSFYAMFQGDDAVYLISNEIKSDLFSTAYEFRNKSILEASRQEITRLALTFKDNDVRLVFERNPEGDWLISNMMDAPTDVVRLEETLSALTAQSVQNFIDDPQPMKEYGLDTPWLTIEARINDQNDFQFDIGGYADSGGKMRFARKNASGPVLLVKKSFFELFKPDFFHYRSKTVCNMDRGVINKIRIEQADRIIELIRLADVGWQMTEPPTSATDSTAVGSYLSTLTYLRATGLKPEQESFGDSSATIRLFSDVNSENALTTLTIGAQPEDGVGRWVICSDNATVFRISGTDVERLLPDPSTFSVVESTD
ncbi:MAG: DUF4340 domain-containing protein [bacterium]